MNQPKYLPVGLPKMPCNHCRKAQAGRMGPAKG